MLYGSKIIQLCYSDSEPHASVMMLLTSLKLDLANAGSVQVNFSKLEYHHKVNLFQFNSNLYAQIVLSADVSGSSVPGGCE